MTRKKRLTAFRQMLATVTHALSGLDVAQINFAVVTHAINVLETVLPLDSSDAVLGVGGLASSASIKPLLEILGKGPRCSFAPITACVHLRFLNISRICSRKDFCEKLRESNNAFARS